MVLYKQDVDRGIPLVAYTRKKLLNYTARRLSDY